MRTKLIALLLLLLAAPLAAQKADTVTTRDSVPAPGWLKTVTRTITITGPVVPPVDTVKPPVPGGLLAITVDPSSVSLAAGGKATFTAKGWGSGGQLPSIANLKWSATGGTITSGGVYTAGSVAGSYAVTASSVTPAGTITSDPASVAVTGTTPPPASNAMYFNSKESACNATALLCDDFEDGDWYTKNCDQANSSGGLLQTDGWCGTIYPAGQPINPPKAAVCGNQGYRSDCAAVSASGGTYGDHSLSQPATDVYVRFYTKPDATYRFGAEKMLTFNKGGAGVGGIWHGDIHLNCGGSGAVGNVQWQNAPNEAECRKTGFALQPGRWAFIEIHLNTTSKVLELWADDCGTTGAGCTGTPTKRLTITNYSVLKSDPVGSLWFENWSDPKSSGKRLVDQIVVRRNGPIGFMN